MELSVELHDPATELLDWVSELLECDKMISTY
jgi:hypothetical protein